MEYQTFTLSSRDEVLRFDSLVDQYLQVRSNFPLSHFSLAKAFDQLQLRDDGGRIFSAVLDIKINFSLLWLDTHNAGATWTTLFSKGQIESASVLDSPTNFFGKMDIHRFNSSYVFRYRALWDKIMGLMILLSAPADYEKFISAKSRKRAFKKIMLSRNLLNQETATSLETLLTKFDDSFRTPEAHGTGVLRKYSFTMESMDKNPTIELLGYWNAINSVLAEIGKMFPKEKP